MKVKNKLKSVVKSNWKILDKNIKKCIINIYFKCLAFFKYSNKNISKNLRALKKTFNFAHLKSGNFLKGNAMFSKQFLRDPFTSGRFCMAALATTLVVVALTACGGGGGGGAAPSGGGVAPVDPGTTTVVITPTIYTAATLCASGPALTSTVSQAVANALVPDSCPTVSTVGVGVSIGTGNMLTITGLPVGVSVSGSTVTMVSGGSTLVFLNGALTSGTPLSNATYTFSGAVIKLTNAPAITIAGTTVSPVIATTCTAPAMRNTVINTCITAPAVTGYTWNSIVAGGIWVADVGVLVTDANLLPATSLVIGDSAWLQFAASGAMKCTATPKTKAAGRPEIFCHYKTVNGVGGDGVTEYYVSMPMMADTVATGGPANQNVGNGGQGNQVSSFKGSVKGVQYTIVSQGCFEFAYDGANYTTTRLGGVGCTI